MVTVTKATLRALPLPRVDGGGDKEARGRVLIVGGSRQVPGAMLLAGVAALRAGAGKLQMATVRDAAIALAIAVPESLVAGVASTRGGELTVGAGFASVVENAKRSDAVLVGPGILSEAAARAVAGAIVKAMGDTTTLVLDGAAIPALTSLRLSDARRARIGITPHTGEMASLLGVSRDEVDRDPPAMALRAARQFGVVVALKGSDTFIATPEGDVYRYRGDCAGLGTSGSGDVLAGVVAGFAARGADPLTSLVWGVWTHGSAGKSLESAMAPVGFLAREIAAELPVHIAATHARSGRRSSSRAKNS